MRRLVARVRNLPNPLKALTGAFASMPDPSPRDDRIIVVTWAVQGVHSILQPRCPWCDWGRGGDEEVSPEVPDPALSK